MNIKVNNLNRYWRPTNNIRFGVKNTYDQPVIKLANYIAKKIKVSPQTTAREALMRGLEALAKEAGIDLSGVVLTETDEVKEHSQTSYQGKNKSQDKKVG